MSLSRKIRRKAVTQKRLAEAMLTEEEYNLIVDAIKRDYLNRLAEYLGTQTLAVACKIVNEQYGKLKNKSTRLQVFGDLYKDALEDWGNDAPLEKYKEYLTAMGESVRWRWEGADENAQ